MEFLWIVLGILCVACWIYCRPHTTMRTGGKRAAAIVVREPLVLDSP